MAQASGDVLAQLKNAEFELNRRIATIKMLSERDLRSMRATFEVNLGFIPDHIKKMPYKDYLNSSPATLENNDPNLRRQSSKLTFNAVPAVTPAPSRSKKNVDVGMLQTPMGARTRAQKKAEAFYLVSAVDGSPLSSFTAETALEVLKRAPKNKETVAAIQAQLKAWEAELGL